MPSERMFVCKRIRCEKFVVSEFEVAAPRSLGESCGPSRKRQVANEATLSRGIHVRLEDALA